MATKFDQVELINLQYCKVSYINLGVIFISEHFRWTNIQAGRISGGSHEKIQYTNNQERKIRFESCDSC